MNLSLEALLTGLILNTFGWAVACWCVKRWADGVSHEIKELTKHLGAVITRAEYQHACERLYIALDERDAKNDDLAQRVARLEVVAGK